MQTSGVIDLESDSLSTPTTPIVYNQTPLKYRHTITVECLQQIQLQRDPEYHSLSWKREWLEQQFTSNRACFSW